MNINYECPECGLEHDIDYTPARPGKIHCHPDNQTPDEDGDIDPMCCEECGCEFSFEKVTEKWNER
jgi:hypothetical protein